MGTDPSCANFVACLGNCLSAGMDPNGCADACAKEEPGGAALYNDLYVCIYCDACFEDCAGQASMAPGTSGCF